MKLINQWVCNVTWFIFLNHILSSFDWDQNHDVVMLLLLWYWEIGKFSMLTRLIIKVSSTEGVSYISLLEVGSCRSAARGGPNPALLNQNLHFHKMPRWFVWIVKFEWVTPQNGPLTRHVIRWESLASIYSWAKQKKKGGCKWDEMECFTVPFTLSAFISS